MISAAFATEVLNGAEGTYGLLMTASGLGALAGAIYLASRSTVLGLGRWIMAASLMLASGAMAKMRVGPCRRYRYANGIRTGRPHTPELKIVHSTAILGSVH